MLISTLYISVHYNASHAEIFLRVKGADCIPKIIALYVVIARLMSVPLQYGASPEKLGDLLTDTQSAPWGPVSGHDRVKHCPSLPDLIGRHLMVEYCGRDEFAHVTRATAETV